MSVSCLQVAYYVHFRACTFIRAYIEIDDKHIQNVVDGI